MAKARPQFRGHYQPHLPADLGFYDLRLPETRQAQAELAEAAGLSAFVFYHYWFNGRRLLERPLEDMLQSSEPQFPFCLAWANENWTRTWDGGHTHILVQQHYSAEDDLNHIRTLRRALTDPRYYAFDGRPVFCVYRASQLPDSRRTTDLWRKEAESWGLKGLYLLRIESFPSERGDPELAGFDAAVDFQPRWTELVEPISRRFFRRALGPRLSLRHRVVAYSAASRRAMSREDPGYILWPGVTPGFDNSPRRQRDALILEGSTPEIFAGWVRDSVRRSTSVAAGAELGTGLVFINAWNEWGEGNHLEPDQRWGSKYLDSLAQELNQCRESRSIIGSQLGRRMVPAS